MVIDFKVPKGWHELTDRQLRRVFGLLAAELDADAIKTILLLEWTETQVVGRQPNGSWLLCRGKDMFEVKNTQISELLQGLDWIGEMPSRPVRLSQIGRHKAIEADFQGVPFESYIMVDNLYQGYLKTQDPALLCDLTEILYGKRIDLKPHEEIAVFYWVASLKDFFSHRFSDFFKPASRQDDNLLGGGEPDIERAMNAQIRALTKGDVTKEREILALDTWRALTELNAQAREYQEMQRKYGNK